MHTFFWNVRSRPNSDYGDLLVPANVLTPDIVTRLKPLPTRCCAPVMIMKSSTQIASLLHQCMMRDSECKVLAGVLDMSRGRLTHMHCPAQLVSEPMDTQAALAAIFSYIGRLHRWAGSCLTYAAMQRQISTTSCPSGLGKVGPSYSLRAS